MMTKIILPALTLMLLGACTPQRHHSKLDPQKFDSLIDGKQTELTQLYNKDILASFTNYGARILELQVPDQEGKSVDVVHGMSSLKGIINSGTRCNGATVGRVSGRIAGGTFQLNNKTYHIAKEGKDALHGGLKGFHYKVWTLASHTDSTVVYTYLSPDGDEGFPGNLNVQVTYTLTSKRTLEIDYRATTDQATPLSMTNHAFFNLNGEGSGSVEQHLLQVNANHYLPIDSMQNALGTKAIVNQTPFDFRTLHPLGDSIDAKNSQISIAGGYDHYFVLDSADYAIKAIGEKTGIVITMQTNQPGVHLFSGNGFRGEHTLKSGAKDSFRSGFCFETQQFDNATNCKDFPTNILNPNQVYKSHIVLCEIS